MKNVIILNHDPLISRIEDAFCIKYLISKGLNIKYLDLSNFYFPLLEAPYKLDRDYVIKIDSETELLEYLESLDLSNTIFISEAMPMWKSRHIYKFLSDNKAKVIKIQIYPNLNFEKKNILKKIRSLTIKDLFKSLGFKLYKKFYKIKIWDEVLTSLDTKEKNKINHPDYEEYVKSKSVTNLSEKYITFLDECFPTHPEIKYWKGNNLQNLVQPYQESLKRLFDRLESEFHKEVVICAHPKSQYKGNEFGNRKIIKGKTAVLVRESAFVLMHSSTSSSFAILNNKPLILLTSDEYKVTDKGTLLYQQNFAELLGLKIFDINKWIPNQNDIKPLDDKKRENFIYSNLTSLKSKHLLNADIIYNYLKHI